MSFSHSAWEYVYLTRQMNRLSVPTVVPQQDRLSKTDSRLSWRREMAAPCHHPYLSRLKADDLLKSAEHDGSYLIRNSESLTGVYILCLLCEGRVHQYRIMKNEENGLIYIPAENASNQQEYCDLRQMIHELSQRGDKNGLRCALRHPINRQEAEEESEDEDDTLNRSPVSSTSSGGAMSSSSSSQTLSSPSTPSLTSPLSPTGRTSPSLPVQPKRKMSSGITPATGSDVTKYLMKRFTNIDLSSQDGQFINDIRNYVDDGITSDIRSSSSDPAQLKQLLISNSAILHKHAQDFLTKIALMNTVFGLPGSQTRTTSLDKEVRSFEVLQIAKDLEQCAQMLTTFHTEASDYIKDLRSQHSERETPPTSLLSTLPRQDKPSRDLIVEKSFRVAGSKLGKFTEKINLTVNVMSGKFEILKLDKSKAETHLHDQVEQVIKSLDHNARINIKLTGKNKMNAYEFTDVWQRETFCQYISRMKKQHLGGQDIDEISVFVGTWNMGSEPPTQDLTNWFQSQGTGKVRDKDLCVMAHDLYVIGTQESSLNEKEWINKIKDRIRNPGCDFHTVACVSSWSIRMVVLVKSEYKNKITRVVTDSVKTGIANTLGNKGGVGVSFSFEGTSLCFVNCHLTSGHERNARRNQNAHDIIKGLSGLKPKGSLSACDIISQFHHVFFLGDLNYRLEDEDPSKIVTMIKTTKAAKNPNYSSLLKLDQLKKTQERRQAFLEFKEEEITFPPTYRIVKGTRDSYDYQKFKATGLRINAPSWCDRVLLHSYPDTYNKWTSYGCVEDMYSSDHKPVFASFDIGILSSQASRGSNNNINIQNVQIIFEQVIAELKSSCKFTSQIDFFSSCLQSSVSSKPNTEFYPVNNDDLCCPKWSAHSLPPPLLPLFDDRDYIADQHLIICVKNVDSQESYGECVLSLKSMISIKPEAFNCCLTHNGEETGSIKGFMHVKIHDAAIPVSKHRRRRSYEYVTTEPLRQAMDFKKLSTIQDSEEPKTPTGPLQKSTSFDCPRSKPVSHHESTRRSGPPATDCINNNGQESRSKSRPRMGQSSLSQGSVIPISGRHSSPPLPSGGQDNNQNPWNVGKDGTMKRSGSSQDATRPMALYDNTQQAALATNLRAEQKNQVESSYDTLKPPITVNEWLLDLGLPEYISLFFSKGWDSMSYVIQDLVKSDLEDIGIPNREHVKRIIESISDMRKKVG